jgi:glycosyltransferase involved in cell wall biosynthesis
MVEVSVILPTYNRAGLLKGAIEALLSQDVDAVMYEVIVVDNNSTDETRSVVDAARRTSRNLAYVFEGRQGVSFALNTGVAASRGRVIALTGDDCRVARNWVRKIHETFERHPEIGFLGSRVVPHWNTAPPPWLTEEHWAPLALTTYGGVCFYTNSERQVCLLGKAFRREALAAAGSFDPRLGRVKGGIGSTEDADMQRRLWNQGFQGMYAPDVIITADVQPERLTKGYHRRWHTGHGRHWARMRVPEFEPSRAYIAGVPLHVFREMILSFVKCMRHRFSAGSHAAFTHEVKLRFSLGFVAERWASWLDTIRSTYLRARRTTLACHRVRTYEARLHGSGRDV